MGPRVGQDLHSNAASSKHKTHRTPSPSQAERVLQRYYTNMNWTIVRPGGLKSEPATGKAVLTEDRMAIGSVHREDVAKLVIEALKR